MIRRLPDDEPAYAWWSYGNCLMVIQHMPDIDTALALWPGTCLVMNRHISDGSYRKCLRWS
jgi:hypothetical protein